VTVALATKTTAPRGQRSNEARHSLKVATPDPEPMKVDLSLATPCPTELTAPINPDRGVEGQRNLFCTYYDGCLDEAVRKGWNSWTCQSCRLFAIQPDLDAGIESYATQRRLA
jgi:hypothetical protein